MREIIFRGKRTDGGGWVWGSLIQEPHRTRIFTAKDDRSSSLREVLPETVGQFIGEVDKQGTKIFENDIVDFDWDFSNGFEKCREVVKFINGCFCVWESRTDIHVSALDCLVVGNLTDTPELLK